MAEPEERVNFPETEKQGVEELQAADHALALRTAEGLGLKLRSARVARRMTLRQLAVEANCSASLLSKIEHDRSTPSLRMLHRIARGLGISIGDLFSEHSDEEVVIYRCGQRPTVQLGRHESSDGVTLERLAPYGANQLLDGYIHVLSPGVTNGGMINHAGQELGYVISGHAELIVGDRVHVLGPGDSFFFQSELPHSYRNIGEDELRILWVNTPPTF